MRQRKSTKKTNSGSRGRTPGSSGSSGTPGNTGVGTPGGKGAGAVFFGRVLPGVLAAAWCMPAMAGPEGAQVVNGNVQIERLGDVTNITASNNAIINYRNFDIAANETVRFIQPDAASRVLNRINSSMPTQIDGTLTANGRVYLVNPSGVFFSKTAVISSGSIYAAAAKISDADFKANIDRFTDAQGVVHNAGQINAIDTVALIGKTVANTGRITAPQGTVMMLAGDEIYIGQRDGKMFTKISTKDAAGDAGGGNAGVTQAGTIEAPGGRVRLGSGDMYSLAIRHSGRTKARDVLIEGGKTGEVRVSGTIDAVNQVQTPNGGRGGEVRVLGETINVSSASIDASGNAGGGTVLVGGNWQGRGPERNAQNVNVDAGSTIKSNASVTGDAGTVVVWSDHTTRFAGTIEGKAAQGTGGLAEISGKRHLGVGGSADLRGSARDGHLLLDPGSVSIVDGGNTAPPGSLDTFNDGFVNAQLALGSLTITTTASTNAAAEDLTVDSAADISWSTGNTLTLVGNNSVTINGTITASGTGNLTLTGGSVLINNDISLSGGTFTSAGTTFTNNNNDTIGVGTGTISLNHTGDVTFGENITGGTISITSGGDLAFNASATSTGTLTASAAGALNVDANLSAATSLSLHSGTDGTGNLVIANNRDLSSASLSLRAGDGVGGGGDAGVVTIGTGVTFRGAAGGATRPNTFVLRQDAAIGDALPAARFGAGVSGMAYTLHSDAGLVDLDDPALVAGTSLTLIAGADSTLDVALSGANAVRSFTFNITGNLGLNENVAATAAGGAGTISSQASGTLDVAGNLTATNSIALHSGTSGVGSMSFTGAGRELNSASISLRAGDGAGGGGDAAIVDITNNVTFRAAAGGATRPGTFLYRQDAAIGAAVDAARFGAALAGMTYTLHSDADAVTIGAAADVADTFLTLNVGASSNLTVNLTGASSLRSFTGSGPLTISGGLNVTTGAATFNGPTTLASNISAANQNITFTDSVTLSGGPRTVNAGTGDVVFNTTSNGSATGTGGSQSLAITGRDVTMELPFSGLSALTITSSRNVGLNADVTATGTIGATANGTLDVRDATLRAATSVSLTADANGTGGENLTFTNTGAPGTPTLRSAAITLTAGDGTTGAGNTSVVDAANVAYANDAGSANPTSVTHRQGGALVDALIAPGSAWVGASPAGVAYTLRSDLQGVVVSTAGKVAGTQLTLRGNTLSTISATLTAGSSLASFSGTGPLSLTGAMNVASGSAQFDGETTLGANVTAANQNIIFTNSVTLATAARTINAGTGAVTFNTTSNAAATGAGGGFGLTLTGGNITVATPFSGLSSFAATGSGNIGLNADITATGTLAATANGTLDVRDAVMRAATSISLTSDADGSGAGNMSFTDTGAAGSPTLRSATINLTAGDGSGNSTNTSSVITSGVSFRNDAGTGNPTAVSHRAGDTITDALIAPASAWSGGAPTAVNYTLRSDRLAVIISTAAKVAGSNLTVNALNPATGSTVALTGTNALRSFTSDAASFQIGNGLEVTNGPAVFNGLAVLAGSGTTVDLISNNNAITFNSGLSLSSTTNRTINAGTGTVSLASGFFDGSGGGSPAGLSITSGDLTFDMSQVAAFDTTALTITSSGNVGINTDLATQDLISITAAGTLDINGSLQAVNSITLASGSDGTGNFTFTGAGREVNSAAISLRAGDGATGTNAAFVDIQSNVSFQAFAGSGTRPNSFSLRQDATLTPVALARFGAGIAGMAYTLISDAGTMNISTAADVADTFLTVGSGTASTISANLTGASSLRSFTSSGPYTISGGLNIAAGAGTRFATFNGPTTLSSDVETEGLPITFTNSITLAGASRTIATNGASSAPNNVVLNTTSNGSATGTGAGFGLTIFGQNVTMSLPFSGLAGFGIDATGNIAIAGDITSTTTLNAVASGTLNVNNATLRSTNAITLRSDRLGQGSRNLTFTGTPTLRSAAITLIAGDGTAGATNTSSAILTNASLRDDAGTANPTSFTHRQGDAIIDSNLAAGSAWSGGSPTGVAYSLRSDRLGIVVDTAAKVRGSDLTIQGAAPSTINANLGTVGDALRSFTANSAVTIASIGGLRVSNGTNGSAVFNAGATVNADVTAADAGGLINFASTLATGSSTVTLSADEIDLGAAVTGTGSLTIQQFSSARNMRLNGTEDAGRLDVTAAEFAFLPGTLTSLIFGASSGTGTLDLGAALTTVAPTTLRAAPTGLVSINQNITAGAPLTVTGPASLAANITSASQAVLFNSRVSVDGGARTIDTTNAGGSAGANITISGQTESATTQDLTLRAGSGNISANSIGATDRLGTLTITSAADVTALSTRATGLVQTAGSGTSNFGAVNTTSGGVNVTGTNFTFANGITSAGGNVGINGVGVTISGGITTTSNATVDILHSGVLAISGTAFNLDGSFTESFSGSGTTTLATGITTSNDNINFNGPVTVTQNVELNAGTVPIRQLASTATFTINSGRTLTLTSDDALLSANFGGTGAVVIQPFTVSTNILLNTTGGGLGLVLDQNEINFLQSTLASVTFGRANSTGVITFADPLTFNATSIFRTTGAGTIAVNSAATGAGAASLTFQGTSAINAAVNTSTGNITIDGGSTIGADMSTGGGNMVFNGPALFSGNRTLNAGTGTIITNSGSGLSFGSSTLTLIADEMDFGGAADSISGAGGVLNLVPFTNGSTFGINLGSAVGTNPPALDLSQADLDTIAANLLRLDIGAISGGLNPIRAGNTNLKAPTRLLATGGGSISVLTGTRVVGVNSGASLTFTGDGAGAGLINLLGGLATSGATITLNDTVSIGGSRLIDTTNAGAAALGANIIFNSDVTGAGGGSPTLILDAGSTGAITAGTIGVGTRLQGLQVLNAGSGTFNGLINVDAVGIDVNGILFSFNAGVNSINAGGFDATHTGQLTIANTAWQLAGPFSQSGTGSVSIGADVTAAGFTLNSATTVTAPVTLSGGLGTLTINGSFAGGGNNITLAADEINFGSSASIFNTGELCLQPVTLNLPITLGGSEQVGSLDLTLADLQRIQTSTGELCIGAANGTGEIRLQGNVTFNRPVRFRGLAPATFVFNADWLVDSGISFNIPVRVGGSPGDTFEFRTGTGTAEFNSTLDINGRGFIITGDEINFAQNVTTTPGGQLTLRPFTFGRGIRIGDTADVSGWLNILEGEVNQIGNNFSLITFGRTDLGAPILFPDTLSTTRTLANPTRLLAGPGLGAITVLRDLKQSDSLESINFEAATINLSRSVVTVGGNINLEGRAILLGDTVLNTNDLGASGPTGGDLNLTALSSIESDTEGARTLTIGTGDGNAVISGEIKTPSIGLVTITGAAAELRNPNITARRLDFAAPVLLFADVTIVGNETDATLNAVNFGGSITGANRNLTINTPGGAITRIAGFVGSSTDRLGTLTSDAAGSTRLALPAQSSTQTNMHVTTVTFNDDVLLLSDAFVDASTQATFTDVDSIGTGTGAPFSLAVTAPSTAFDGRVGVGAAGGSALRAISTSGTGTTLIRTDQITVTDGAFFNNALDLGDNVTLTAGNARFNTINSVNVSRDLIVNAGDTIFGDNIGTGSGRPILGLLRTDASGTTSLDAAQVSATSVEFLDVLTVEQSSTITATSRIELGNTVSAGVVNADLSLDSPSTTLSGVLGVGNTGFGTLGVIRSGSTFTVNAAASSGPSVRAQNIVVNGTTILGQNGQAELIVEATQAATFNAISAQDALGSPRSFQVRSPGTVTFNGDVGTAINGRLAGFTTDAGGTTRFNAATLSAGAISIADALVLGNNATFISGGAANFGSTIDSDSAGTPRDFTINSTGTARLDGIVGGTARLGAFASAGASIINTDRINAASASFLNPVTLQRSTTIDTTGNQLFTGEVNGGSLAIITALTNIAGGNVSYTANVGFNPDGTFGLAPSSLTTTAANISLRSVRTGGNQTYTIQPSGGAVSLAGGLTSTSAGAIAVAGPLVLTGDGSVITAGNASFLGTVNSDTTARTLNVEADGLTLFTGEVGGTNPLRRLRTNAAGTTRFDTASLRATERLEFLDAVTLVRDTTLTGGSISFGGTVDGTTAGVEDLVLNTSPGASKSFAGNVGGNVRLGTLTTNAAGVTQVTGATISTTGNQTYNDSLAVSNGTLAVGGNLLVAGSAGVNGNVDAEAITVNGPASFSGTVSSRTGGQTYNSALTLQSGVLNSATALFVANTATINGTATSVGNTTIGGGLNMNGGSLTSTTGGISVAGPGDANGTLTSNGPTGITLTGGGRYFRELTANNAGSINVTQATTLGADVVAAGTGNVTLVDPTLAAGLVRAANGAVTVNGTARLNRASVNIDGRTVSLAAVDSLLGGDAASSLVVTAADSAALNGPIGAGTRVANFAVTRRGGDNLSGISLGNAVNATGKATFGASTITLTGDTTIDAGNGMLFRGNIVSDGTPRNLTVRFDRTPTFNANGVELPAGDVTPVVFGGNLGGAGGQALRDLTLGGDLTAVPELATFIMTSASQIQNDGSVLTTDTAFIPAAPFQIIATGNIRMGARQKFTALGSLAMLAGGTASLSDMVALNELGVTAPTIELIRRASGASLLPRSLASPTTYQLERDSGVDFVADRIAFDGAIFAVGDGPVPVFSARAGAISGVDLLTFGFKTLEEASFPPVFRDYRFAANANPGSLRFLGLDYVAGATPVNIASAIAGAIPRDTRPPRIEVRTDLTKEALDILLAMGITVKSDDGADSVLEALTGRGFYDDVPAKPFPGQDDYRVSARRLDPGGVTALVRQYVKVFGSTGADATPGIVGQGTLGESARRYAEKVGAENATTQGFRAWVEATPEEAASLAVLNEARTMLSLTERIGLSAFEASRAKSAISRLVLDAEQVSFGDERPLSTDEMESAITGEPVREREPATDPATDPAEVPDPAAPEEAAAPTAP